MDGSEDGAASGTTLAPTATTNPASDAALARHAQRMRPLRLIYALVLTVAAVVIALVVVIAYNRGEISHATLKPVASGLPSLALHPPSRTVARAWTTTDATAIGTPYYRGTVVTHDAHTVRGRNARTGKPTWSYTRTDRSVCTAIQNQGLTIAVYKLHGNCDELTAFSSSTGARKWDRTLDKDTAEFNGPATYQVQPGNVMFVSGTSIYSIAASGIDYWTFHHVGCTINGAVLGPAGVLISQTCHNEDCNGAKFCGNGTQLLLRDGTANYNDDSKTNGNNPDRITWNKRGNDLVPTLAGRNVAARAPEGGTLQLLDAKKGTLGARITLSGRSDRTAPSVATSSSDADLLWLGGRTYALDTGATSFSWQADTRSVPTIIDARGRDDTPLLSAADVAVPTSGGVALLDPATGQVQRSFATAAPASGSLVFPLGSGFVVAGPTTTVYK